MPLPLQRSPLKALLVFVPLGLALDHQGSAVNPLLVFVLNGIAIVPLANLISQYVDQIVDHLGEQWGGCLNATLGNLVELIIAYSALTGGLYEVVVDGLVGGLVTNLLLVLGAAAFVGGMRYRRMAINTHTALLNAKLLMAVMMVAFVPSALMHLRMFASMDRHIGYSLLMAACLLVFYGLSYVYQFLTHGELFCTASIASIEDELNAGPQALATPTTGSMSPLTAPKASLGKALIALALTTVVLVFSAGALVDGLAASVARFHLSTFFTGVFLLPLFGSAAEFVVSLRAAQRNRMDLAVATTVGSSIQIVLFVLPVLILIGACIGRPLGIFFAAEAMIAVIVSVFAVQWVTEDGTLDWFEGAFLIMIYVLLMASSFFLL